MNDIQSVDVLIIGAGASGLFCAIEAAKRGRNVLVVDHANKAGKKILMSGGGRCNFTNMDVTPAHYLSQNPHFVRSALSRYSQWDFIGLVCQHEVAYHERDHGQLFCDNNSKDILNLLLSELKTAGAQLQLNTKIESVEKKDGLFLLQSSSGVIQAQSLVVATGGLSIPTMGASDFGYKIAQQFGHSLVEYRASLVPFTWNTADKQSWSELSGLSQTVTVSTESGQAFHLDALITHRGLSGPAMLQISNYWQPGEALFIDWLPSIEIEVEIQQARHQQGKKQLKNFLTGFMPTRLAEHFCALWQLEKLLADLTKDDVATIKSQLHQWCFKPGGTEGYRTAEVTLGGVSTEQVSSKTMQSQLCENLYLIGEVLDVTGHLGGYNFQWAWSSGWAAGQEC
ncbi:NAD(P)/FAD-dependent oxidoreductase [Reinekea thalattae]|uniref:NAD(P)/FAD-dependent oxidoreductase n=1 Tax=Reinekea thalattae TaxID=2593301 RepID=A0A5C8Z4H8_9GAMM|nr:NAD(P)/FAD-dependent oxidoreductase [Reinekea thalattae]TXR52123.1 NAD(P)/FAD-dependent oxidoreductase [Reinekea thalattae]